MSLSLFSAARLFCRTVNARHFWPVMVLLLACFGAVLVVLAVTTRAQDDLQAAQETQALENAVKSLKYNIRHDLEDYAKWDDAVRHISKNFDADWVDDNVVAYLGRQQGYEQIFILDGEDRTIFRFGKLVQRCRAPEVSQTRNCYDLLHACAICPELEVRSRLASAAGAAN